MSSHEQAVGLTDEYYTPPSVFKGLGNPKFDLDVASPKNPKSAFVVARNYLTERSLETEWLGFVWCNPPYGVRGSKMQWILKMISHMNGLLLTPDRSSADWWQVAGKGCSAMLTAYDKIKFVGAFGGPIIGKKGLPVNAPGT